MMKRIQTLGLIALLLLSILIVSTSQAQADPAAQRVSPDAPSETAQFAPLIGDWVIQDYQRDANGDWQPGAGADWRFYWILDGHAIQDDWIAPGRASEAPESGRQYGTNIRIYNPKQDRWEMAWASSKGQKVDTFTATRTDQGILMEGVFAGNPSRILFHDLRENRFSWNLRVADAEGQWQEVYRIEGTRRGTTDQENAQ